MYSLLCNAMYFIVIPLLLFFFFCRYCSFTFRWKHCFCYLFCFAFLLQIEMHTNNGFYWLILEILELSLYGKGMFLKKFMIAALIYSIYSICNGFVQFVFFWLLCHFPNISVLQYGDIIHMGMVLLLTVCLLCLLLNYFDKNITVGEISFMMPFFFIAVVERIISNQIYGDTIIWDDKAGMIFPVINHTTIFLLQLFALVCFFTSLIAYQNIKKSVYAEQTIQLLKQQYHLQKIYMQEAQIRYEKTRSFRHDIKNHFAVLAELLKENHTQKASAYLYDLQRISDDLSFEVQTGNVVIDALLNSKFSVAAQKNIAIDCNLKVTEKIKEIDWCIVLCNALDNAIAESDKISEKYICVKGENKGNFYLLSIQNNCRKEMKQVPTWGIGLHNIHAVCQKYNGTMQAELRNGMYCLDMLFFFSQQ